MLEDIFKFSKKITLWGSSNVVNKWVQFRGNAINPNSVTENIHLMEDIVNEMRKDLGIKKTKKGNLIMAFLINDIKEKMKEVKK